MKKLMIMGAGIYQVPLIKKAKEMLKSDYSSITDIALSLGYNNVYDFSRDFKKCTGMSPLKYKKQ